MDFEAVARRNLDTLGANPYPGRGIIIGCSESKYHIIQAYWIMGRSENSRNRVFESEGGRVFTAAVDEAKVKDPSLIFYNAMVEAGGRYVVSNGSQTDAVWTDLELGRSFGGSLLGWGYEPDNPNFTPRITGVATLTGSDHDYTALAIHRKSALGNGCDRSFYEYPVLVQGFGYCITTYSGNGDPLPAFRGDPFLLPLRGGLQTILNTLWEALDTSNRVALAVKVIHVPTGTSTVAIRNRFRNS